VRRVHVDVARFPVYRERLSATTWCSGTGSRWAERRVSVTGELGGHAEAVTLWVCVDATTGRPAPLTARFHEVYGPSAEGRTVRARLQHDDPPPGVTPHPWPLRFSDFDVMGHVNNAAYWQIVEEQLARRRDLRAPLRAEMEFRGGVDVGDACEVVSVDSTASLSCWVLVDGDVRASATVASSDRSGPVASSDPSGPVTAGEPVG